MASRKGKLRGIHSKGTVDKERFSRFFYIYSQFDMFVCFKGSMAVTVHLLTKSLD